MKVLGAALLALSAAFAGLAVHTATATAQAPGEVTYLSEAEGAAVRLQVTREGILPVPNMLDTFLPLARTRAESPVTREALAAPVYDTTISNLSGLLCLGTGGAICPPGYPLQASVRQPGAGDDSAQTPVPPFAVGPFEARAGYGEARADADGASAEATAGGLRLDPAGASGTAFEPLGTASGAAAAADGLAAVLRRLAPGWTAEADDALLRVDALAASAESLVENDDVLAAATAEVGGVSLLGGLIQVETVRAEAAVDDGKATGGTQAAGVTVGPFEAHLDDEGLRITDRDLTPAGREDLEAALEELSPVLTVRAGGLRSTPRPGGRDASAVALELRYRRELVANTGADVVVLALGVARATAATQTLTPPVATGGGAGTSAGLTRPPVGTEVSGGAAARPAQSSGPPSDGGGPRLTTIDEPSVAGSRERGPLLPDFPGRMLVLVLLAGTAGAAGLTLLSGWQVVEE